MIIIEGLVAPENPTEGAGEPINQENAPARVYHGTNPIAAAAIWKMGKISPDYPVDGNAPVVCVTECPDMGSCFAYEFARFNSEFDMGFVFEIDSKAVAKTHKMYPYHAETAGAFEFEYRIEGEIDRGQIRGVRLVGEPDRLLYALAGRDDDFVDDLWDAAEDFHLTQFFGSADGLVKALKELAKIAH